MGLDEDISTAIEAQLIVDEINTAEITNAIVTNTLDTKSTKLPWINVNTDGSGPRTPADLTTFYRKELPFNVEVRGSNADDADALESSVERAIIGMNTSLTSSWMEFTSGVKLEVVKKYQKWITGKKVLYEDVSA